MTAHHKFSTKVCLALTAGLFVVLGAVSASADATWLEVDEGLGQYDYIEKDSTTYIHYGTDWGSWNYAAVWVYVGDGTGYDYPANWAHDAGADKHLSTGNLGSGNHGTDWAAGNAIDLYPKVDDDPGGGSPTQSTYTDEMLVIDVAKSDISGSIYDGGVQLVLQFSIDVNNNAGRDVTRLWVENVGSLQEGDAADIPNNGLSLFYEAGTGFSFDGDESSVTLYGDYASDDGANERWGNNGLSGIDIPSDGTSNL